MARSERLKISADEGRLGEVRDFVTRVGSRYGLAERAVANVRLAVDEACTNVIKHAYAESKGNVDIEILKHRRWLEVRIRDQGKPFDGVVKKPDLERYIETRRKGGFGVYLMYRVVDKVHYESTAEGNVWVLKKRLPRDPAFGRTLRMRYSMRSALVLALLTTLACIPLWMQEGRSQRHAAEQELRALAFSVVETARPVLRQHVELSPEQTRLFEALHALMLRDPRLLSLSVVDHDGIIWAADRTAATFNRFVEPAGLGAPDAVGIRTTVQSIENETVAHLAALVRTGASDGRRLGSVHVSIRWTQVDAAIQQARLRLVALALIFYVLSTAILAGLIGTVLVPVQRLVEGLSFMNQDDAGLSVEGPKEIGAIAAAFNDLNSRMRSAREDAEEHENLQKDLDLAREIQETLLPRTPPSIPGYELARIYEPAQNIGGDYYDFLQVNDEMTGIVVADVSGKGVPGSLVMGMLRTALHMEARNNTNAGDVLARMNAFLSADMRKGMFVTMFYVILDSKNRVVSYASAGHTPMVLYRAASKETFFLKPRGFPVGLKLPDNTSFSRSLDVERLRLHQGDMLVLYTDGITEAMNDQREQYGEPRLLESIRRLGECSATQFVDAMQAELSDFTGSATQSDDITLVAIKETTTPVEQSGGIRQKLVDLVDEHGLSVEAACQQLKISPSTYYRFRHREESTAPESNVGSEAASERQRPFQNSRPVPELRVTRAQSPQHPAPAESQKASHLETPQTEDLEMHESNLRGSAAAFESDEKRAVVHLEGFIDSSSCAALERLLNAAAAQWPSLVVDLEQVAFLSSRAWGVLASYVNQLHHRGGELVLCGMRKEVADVYRMLGFEAIIRAFDARQPACDALSNPPAHRDAKLKASAAESRRSSGSGGAQGSRRKSKKAKKSSTGAGSTAATPPLRKTTGVAAPNSVGEVPAVLAGLENIDAEWESLRVRSGCVGPAGEVTLLALEGVLDTVSAHRFQNIIEEVMRSGASRILIDLSCTEFVSSAGWGVFSGYLRDLRAMGGDLKLFGMNRELARIYELLNLQSILASFDLLADALGDFGLQPAATGSEVNEAEGESDHADSGCNRDGHWSKRQTHSGFGQLHGEETAEFMAGPDRSSERAAIAVNVVESRASSASEKPGELSFRPQFQARCKARLSPVRLPEEEFAKDADLRREGWNTYLGLLREACSEEEA